MEPAEALKSFETLPGFHIELAAHEPDVVDPVAAALTSKAVSSWPRCATTPFAPRKATSPPARCACSPIPDGDGVYDKSTVYADELLWPTGVVCSNGGVYVAAAPNVYYFKDTDGDGVADERRVVFAGFGTQNEQGSVNCLTWGSTARSTPAARKMAARFAPGDDSQSDPIGISGRDFCFDPRDEKLELVHRRRAIRQRLRRLGQSLLMRSGQSVDGGHAAKSLPGPQSAVGRARPGE